MEKYAILLGYFEKQLAILNKIEKRITSINLSVQYSDAEFAIGTQQFFTALEDLFKQIAKTFENHIEDLGPYHKELLIRMNTEIPRIRPQVVQQKTLIFLDKIHSFSYFLWHAYDCKLDKKQLLDIQSLIKQNFHLVTSDLDQFRGYIHRLSTDVENEP